MIEEEFVTLETAKLLKAAGFPQDERFAYSPEGSLLGHAPFRDYHLAAPNQAQAMRWMRGKNGEKIHINIYTSDQVVGLWNYQIERLDVDPDVDYDTGGWYTSYEEAAEAGLQRACTYLIKKGGAS